MWIADFVAGGSFARRLPGQQRIIRWQGNDCGRAGPGTCHDGRRHARAHTGPGTRHDCHHTRAEGNPH